jgi:hypothetical protein
VASVMGAVALAYRRGGAALMFATAIAIPLMLASLPAETYADVWNSSAPILPLVLLVFMAWSIACGEYRLLPLAVAVASFEAQAHLTFVPPALGVLLVGVACAVVLGEARRWPRRWVVATLVVAAVCWSAPLIDQAVNRPGNFVVLARSALSDEPTVGFSSGWKSVTHTIGIPPWWLEENRQTLQRVEDLTTRPHPLSIVSAVLMLGALAVIAIVGWRRRSSDLLGAGALGLTLSAASWIAASSTPIGSFGTVGYTLRWTSAAGMCVWLLLGWSLVKLSGARARAPAYATAVAAGATAVVALAVAIAENPPRREPYQPMRAIYDSLEARLPARGGTRVEVSSSGDTIGLGSELAVGIVYWLRRHGRTVVTSPEVADRLSSAYERGSYERVVHVFVDVEPDTGRAIARMPVRDPLDQSTTRNVTVTMTPTARRSARGSRAGSPPRRIAWSSRDSHAGTARHR